VHHTMLPIDHLSEVCVFFWLMTYNRSTKFQLPPAASNVAGG